MKDNGPAASYWRVLAAPCKDIIVKDNGHVLTASYWRVLAAPGKDIIVKDNGPAASYWRVLVAPCKDIIALGEYLQLLVKTL